MKPTNFVRVVFISLFALMVMATVGSCKIARLENKAIKQAERTQRKADKKFTKEYDKKYKHQTKIQSEPQRTMIKQSRKKPKNMKSTQTFFLFRWFGISN